MNQNTENAIPDITRGLHGQPDTLDIEVTEEFPPRSMDPGLAPLFKALAKAQAEITSAKRMQVNPFMEKRGQKPTYSDLNDTWNACREALTKNGLCVIQMPSADGPKVTVTTVLGHESGASIQSALTMTSVESDPQTIGKLITYARKYALSAFAGVASEDDDGTAASGKGAESDAPGAQKPAKPGKSEPKKENSYNLIWEDPLGSGQWFELDRVVGLEKAKARADELAKEKSRDIFVTDANKTEYVAKLAPAEEKKSGSGQAPENGRIGKIKLGIDNAKDLIGGSSRTAGLELTAFLVGYMGVQPPPKPADALEAYEEAIPAVIKALGDPASHAKFKRDQRGFGIELSGRSGDALENDFNIWGWDQETRAVARQLYAARRMEASTDFRNYMDAISADKMPSQDAKALMRVALVTRNAWKLNELAAKTKVPMHELVAELEKYASLTPTHDKSLASGQEAAIDYAIENLSTKINPRA